MSQNPTQPRTVAEAANEDFQKGLEAMSRRAMALGMSDPTVNEITEFDRRAFGQAVRFEIDVCQPIPQLKAEINFIRAKLTNCLVLLEQNASGNTRRRMVHSDLTAMRGELKYRRNERKVRESRQPKQTD